MLSWRNIEDGRQVRIALLLLLSLLLATAHAAYAQAERAAATQGRWLPRETRPNSRLMPAQWTEVRAFFDKVERIFKQVPELANPDGYEILPVIGGGVRQAAPGFEGLSQPNSIIEYELHLGFYVPSRKMVPERTNCITIWANRPLQARLRDAQGEIYIEPDRFNPPTDPNNGDSRVARKAVQVYGELWNIPREHNRVDVVFATAGELPWKPVSREQYYRAALQKTPYQVWMEGAAQRKADRETALAGLKAAGILADSAIERTRREQEAIEREVAENFRKEEANHRARQSEAHTLSFAWGDSLNAEPARMTPEELRMPAIISKTTSEGPRASGAVLTTDLEAVPHARLGRTQQPARSTAVKRGHDSRGAARNSLTSNHPARNHVTQG